MIYRISHSIIYTPDDGSIKLISDDPSYFSTGEITLAPTANRLLSLLIAHHGSILQRDELLEQVWDAHGLKASNNSLNQYVSMLRRNFADLGIEEVVIVTIPTVGFMFSKDIDVSIESSLPIEPSTAEKAAPEIITDTGEALSTAAPKSKAVVKNKWQKFIISALVFLTLANGIYYFLSVTPSPSFESRYLVGKIDSCPVYSFYHTDRTNRDKLLALANDSLKNSDLSCRLGSDIYLKVGDSALQGKKAMIFVSICEQINDDKYSSCHSNYTN